LLKGLAKGQTNTTLNTSEQQVLNCGNGTCDGGYVQLSANTLASKNLGLVSETDLPYKGK
jgi:hypothetical protein